MFSERLRKQLEQLQRVVACEPSRERSIAPGVRSTSLRIFEAQREGDRPTSESNSNPLEAAENQVEPVKRPSPNHESEWAAPIDSPLCSLESGHEVTTDWGTHWLVRQSLEQMWPASKRYLCEDGSLRPVPQWRRIGPLVNGPLAEASTKTTTMATDASQTPQERLTTSTPSLEATLRAFFPQRTLFLDLETCGLAGCSIFLIGLIHLHEGRLTISQLWARHYGEEKAILHTLLQIASQCQTLVTFNGKSFDWPQICDRCTLHHLEIPKQEPPKIKPRAKETPRAMLLDNEWWHFDLLHASRKRWRGQVPNCRLQTLERLICGRHRVDDLPGREIPQAYHDYVRHGRLDQIPGILHHNMLDLVTLLQLMLVFLNDASDA